MTVEGNDGRSQRWSSTGNHVSSKRLANGPPRSESEAMVATRIWIARPEPGATRTAERLSALGFEPLVAPVLVVAATDAPLPEGPFDGLVVTSANALRQASRWHPLHSVPVFAVGARTAALARECGFTSVKTADGNAADLVGLVEREVLPGASLLHVAGEDRKAEPEASLTRAGFRLTSHIAYGARAVPSLPALVALALARPVHADRRAALLKKKRRDGLRTRHQGGIWRSFRGAQALLLVGGRGGSPGSGWDRSPFRCRAGQ